MPMLKCMGTERTALLNFPTPATVVRATAGPFLRRGSVGSWLLVKASSLCAEGVGEMLVR